MAVDVSISDEFEAIKKSWEDHYDSKLPDERSYSRGETRRPDTIIVQGVPSRWLAEPRVSSKPSMLNTHTIFSVLGKIRNLYISGVDDIVKNTEGAIGDVVPGLQCKVWVQFESYDEFSNAVRVLCGRSMQKEGSRLRVDYEVTWDKDTFFRNLQQTSTKGQQRYTQVLASSVHVRNESPRYDFEAVRSAPAGAQIKRFRVGVLMPFVYSLNQLSLNISPAMPFDMSYAISLCLNILYDI
ncbi:hypothetical protein KSP39_PZI015288 [Platanthera zijinensis]|uniref:Uncharacterized protein n=1 Tax=Platanthera zijinensis TaxID=2320716 RepID=A0AAP0B8N9_9ASPA